MDNEIAWQTEERLWLEGSSAYAELMHDECVMAFPAPIGILRGPEIIQTLENAPRWAAVTMTGAALSRPDEETIVLGYHAEGKRNADEPYKAFCTSTYRAQNAENWMLVQHQQTPVV